MSNVEKDVRDYQVELFDLLAEFFGRAVGELPTTFATIEDFSEKIRRNASVLAHRGTDAFPWAYHNLGRFYAEKGPALFKAASRIGGLKLVLGGSSRFRGSQLACVNGSLLYADTILIPDPVAPWLESERKEEKFRDVLMLQAAHALLHLKPFIDAELPGCPVLVFPSWEKALEEHDPKTTQGIFQLLADISARYIDPSITSMEELTNYMRDKPDAFLDGIEKNKLFIAPGGPIGRPIKETLAHYETELSTWRTKTWLAEYNRLPVVAKVANALVERVAPQFHLVENAENLSAHPLICIEQQAHYFRIVADVNASRLERAGLLNSKTKAILAGLTSERLEWLTQVPVEALVELRRNNDNVAFRKSLFSAVGTLHEATLEDTDRVAAEICREIDSGIADHNRLVRETVQKNKTKYAQWGAAAVLAGVGVLVPSLAPQIAAILPLIPAGKLAFDVWDHANEKKRQAKSLMGVLAVARDAEP